MILETLLFSFWDFFLSVGMVFNEIYCQKLNMIIYINFITFISHYHSDFVFEGI